MAKPEFLDVPPAEAVRDFRAKGLHIGFHWRDTDEAQHLISFTAAKAARLDVLQALRNEVDRAIAEGVTFETFRKDLEPKLRSLGWWGRQPMLDPKTGKTSIVQLGSVRRLRTIFDTNLRMAYSRGRWERIERIAADAPYLRYVAVLDARTRPDHLRWHGTVLPWDHPFWRTYYPPNGWHCRCTVMQLSDDDLEEFGWKVTGPPDGWDRTRTWIDRRNEDRRVQVPVGVDPGFQFNVGLINMQKASSDRLIRKIDVAAPDLGRAAVGSPARTALFRRFVENATEESEHGDFAIAMFDGATRARSKVVRLSGETAAKQRRHHRDLGAEDYGLVQRILDEGELFEAQRDRHMIGFIENNGLLWRAVVKSTVDGSETYLVSLHRAQPYDQRAARRRLRRIDREEE